MRTLYSGCVGDDVTSWQNFLLGKFHENILVSGHFDALTVSATIDFQTKNSLNPDGNVGPMTLARALQLGLAVVSDDRQDSSNLNWPIKPSGIEALTEVQRETLFTKFSYIAAPTPQNKEAIKITDNWAKTNIVTVNVPQLKNVIGAPKNCNVDCHKLIAKQLVNAFVVWEKAGLIDRIITWNGCWVPRFKRGSTSSLSNHSWGTAFDINAQWNSLGSTPAKLGEKGCVRELMLVAVDHGWFNGSWFGMVDGKYGNRCDSMHFEAYKLI